MNMIRRADEIVAEIQATDKLIADKEAEHRRTLAGLGEARDALRAELDKLLPSYYKSRGIDVL